MPTPRRLLSPALLPDDLVEKIVLRFPPDDPAGLLDAALVCKDWCRVICSPDFRRRFREFHRNPPLLGILYRSGGGDSNQQLETHFMPTSTFRLRLPSSRNKNTSQWRAIDTLHGRILLWDDASRRAFTWPELVVWSPVPSQTRRLPVMRHYMYTNIWSAALLCAATAGCDCDHLDCTSSSGAFFVVLVGKDATTTYAHVYSSEQNVWTEAGYVRDHNVHAGVKRPGARVGNMVYFICEKSDHLLAYELRKKKLSFVSIPSEFRDYSNRFTAFTAADEGKLGLATAGCFRLVTWSREAGVSLDDGDDAGWTQQRVFELDKLLPSSCTFSFKYDFFATTNNNGVIVMKGNTLLFAIDLMSGKAKRLLEGCAVESIYDIVPYIGFCTPSLPQCKFILM